MQGGGVIGRSSCELNVLPAVEMMPCISVEGTIQEVKAKDYSTGLAYLYTSREHSLGSSRPAL